jgi:hypothetical protein
MRLKWKLVSVRLETVLVSLQDRCTVCTKYTIASEIILDAPDGFLGARLNWKLVLVCLDIVLILILDRSTVCTERTVRSEIVLDAPDGTAR